MATAFEGWAMIELFGHRVLYGHFSEVTVCGATFARIDIPSDPPTFELKNASALYGIRPLTEEQVRRYHQPPARLDRPALADATDADLVDEDNDPFAEDDESEDDALCGNCGLELGDEPTERVALDDGTDAETWHKRCAEKDAERLDPEDDDPLPDPIDSDAPQGAA